MKHSLRLSDGSVITSGTGTLPAIASVELTQWANTQEALTYGGVCADVMELTLLSTEDVLREGERVELWQEETLVGIFFLQKPKRESKLRLKCTAADSVSLLDKDITAWFDKLEQWPYSMGELARLVCAFCGVEFATDNFPGASLTVEKFSPGQLTGRQMLSWIAAAAGRFCRANSQGQLEFSDYAPTDLYLGDREDHLYGVAENTLYFQCPEITAGVEEGGLCLTWQAMSTQQDGADLTIFLPRQCYYYENTLSLGEVAAQPAQKVVIRKTAQDVGVVYPQEAGDVPAYILQGDPLLFSAAQQDLQQVASELHSALCPHSYTPGKLTIPQGLGVMPGQILKLCRDGVVHQIYVMKQTLRSQKLTIECTAGGYDSAPTVNQQTFAAVNGKMLELQMGMEGLRAEHSDSDAKRAALELSVDAIRAQVEAANGEHESRLSALELDEESLRLRLESVEKEGVSQVTTETGYTFSRDGLRITKSGQEMENLLDHTGMYVKRSGQTILQANSKGVEAVDVTVGNYLTVGHARFEEYESGRTACYYIG